MSFRKPNINYESFTDSHHFPPQKQPDFSRSEAKMVRDQIPLNSSRVVSEKLDMSEMGQQANRQKMFFKTLCHQLNLSSHSGNFPSMMQVFMNH